MSALPTPCSKWGSLAGSPRLTSDHIHEGHATYPNNICGKYCTDFLIHDRVLGVAVLVWLCALLYARALLHSLFLCKSSYTACGPLSTAIWWSRQCRAVLFLLLVQQPETDFP